MIPHRKWVSERISIVITSIIHVHHFSYISYISIYVIVCPDFVVSTLVTFFPWCPSKFRVCYFPSFEGPLLMMCLVLFPPLWLSALPWLLSPAPCCPALPSVSPSVFVSMLPTRAFVFQFHGLLLLFTVFCLCPFWLSLPWLDWLPWFTPHSAFDFAKLYHYTKGI